MRNIILASSSPQRKMLLDLVGIKYTVIPSDIEEVIDYRKEPFEVVQELAYQKAISVLNKCNSNDVIIGSDTIVYLDQIYGKPKDENDARYTLSRLQGNTHSVFTGLCVIDNATGKIYKTYNQTKVTFRELNEAQIDNYIKTKEPLNRAGSYAIQGIGATLVERIDGCFYSIVGLPIQKLAIILEEINSNII